MVLKVHISAIQKMNCRITNVYFKKLIDCGSNKSQLHLSGGYDEKVTPVPIPNTAVKLLSADDTWLVTARESKSPPDLYQNPVFIRHRVLCYAWMADIS